MIDAERYHRIDEIFQAALELDPRERTSYISQACSGDESLVEEVEYLLSSDEQEWKLLGTPAFEMVAPLLAVDRPELDAGDSVGHYKVVSLLGVGGMGHVYLAEDTKLGRKVALKLLPTSYTQDGSRLRRFQQEARAASALNHPNILTIHELGEVNGRQFIATEFVEGGTLRERMRRASFSLPETLDIATQVAGALAAAHRAGIVHRDIKPENIMLRADGYVKVLDFGLAKLTEQRESSDQTQAARMNTLPGAGDVNISSGLVMGTVKYMSPEQARGQQVDPRSDIFSLGVVLYEMLTGRAPFKGKTTNELIGAILKREPPPLTDIPEELRRLIAKALRKKKQERYQTIEELLVNLKSLKEDKRVTSVSAQTAARKISGSVLATSETAAVSTATTLEYVVSGIKRHKISAALMFASLAIVAVGLTVGLNRLSSKLRASSKAAKMTLVPNADKALSVAISPNGEYIAYAEMTDVGKPSAEPSLWVQEVGTNNRVEIVPPADISYGGLTYSRDGADIFYINVNNDMLYRVPARGGEVTKVLTDVGGSISFAPDGKQFAFVRLLDGGDTALMAANVDGSGERVVATRKKPEFLNWPAWSPDGSLIACATGVLAKSRQMTLIGFAVTTGEEKRITDQKWDELPGRMTWLPDGSGLIASASENAENQVWQIPYPPSEAYRITGDPNYLYYDLSIASDGKNLVTIKSAWRSSLWMVPSGNSGAAKPITSGEHHLYRHVAWTADGRILYASSIGTSRDIWIINGDGTEPKQLTANAGVNLQPQPSADGRYVVFSSNRANKGAFNLWRMDIDGSNPVQLTHGRGEGQPVCSPDGLWVVYSEGGPNTTPEQKTLWKVPIDGGEPVQLCDRPSSGAAVSPDNTLIACWYKQDSASTSKIALIPFAGGPPIKVFEAIRTSIYPVRWSPDGQAINYIDAHPFVSNIWSQPVSGGPPKQITQFTSEQIDGFDWSRDGQLMCSRLHSVQDVVLISDFK
jgi:serine/threonine protein kinase/Tol biopolymer transport system component